MEKVPSIFDEMANVDLLSTSKASPLLTNHLKADVGSGLLIPDYVGTDDLTFDTTINATPVAAGFTWTADGGIQFPASAATHNAFLAASKTPYDFAKAGRNALWAYRIRVDGALSATISLLCKRGATGVTEQGHQHALLATSVTPQLRTYNGSAFVISGASSNTITTSEIYTVLFGLDNTTNTGYIVIASDTTIVGFTSESLAGTGTNDTSSSTQIACLGARSFSNISSEPSFNMTFYSLQTYYDTSGNPLPVADLGKIARFLHANPGSYIPASWYS